MANKVTEAVVEELTGNSTKEAEATSTNSAEQPTTVPVEVYENLYNQAVELDNRYQKLFGLYNDLLEKYLTQGK